MSLRTRKNIAGLLILALVLWPLAHYVLAAGIGFSPWKFFGWAMYTTPPPRHRMQLGETVGEGIDWNRDRALPEELVDEGFRFLELRNIYGELLKPGRFAARILDAFPDMEGAAIRIRKYVLDRASATIEPEDRVYTYRR